MTYRPFENMAESHLDIVSRSGSEWMCACPYCGRASSLQFNVVKGLFNCFACSTGGTAKKLIQYVGGAYHQPGVSLDALQEELRRAFLPPEETRILPESFLRRFGGKPHEYWTKVRGFSDATIQEWSLGYDPLGPRLGTERIGPSCTIPYRDHQGGLLGVFHRRLGDGFPRYIYPRGFDRVGSLFGSWHLFREPGPEAVVLVEGSLDAISVRGKSGHPSVAQYGSTISRLQVRLLRRSGIREVTLFYDYDPAGIKATRQGSQELDGFIVRSVMWDKDKYCWHEKVCGCPMRHSPLEHEFGTCPRRIACRCGRIHGADPGQLSSTDISHMVSNAELVGRKPTWHVARRTVKLRGARGNPRRA